MTLAVCAALRTPFWEKYRQFELHLSERNKHDERTAHHVMGGMMEKPGLFLLEKILGNNSWLSLQIFYPMEEDKAY